MLVVPARRLLEDTIIIFKQVMTVFHFAKFDKIITVAVDFGSLFNEAADASFRLKRHHDVWSKFGAIDQQRTCSNFQLFQCNQIRLFSLLSYGIF